MDIDKLHGGSNPFRKKGTQYAKDQSLIRKLSKTKPKKKKKPIRKIRKPDIPFQTPKEFKVPKKIKVAKQITAKEIKTSLGESIIADWLRKHNISFNAEKKFNELTCPRTGNHLRYDFFIPKLKMCIEFDGIQHFKYCKQFDGEDRTLVVKRQERDRLKDRHCEFRGFKMLRIKYTQIKKIEAILCKNCL